MVSATSKTHFLAALRRMLRPVVRQLIQYGITYPAAAELLKVLYLTVAEEDFALPFKRQTDSRLAVVTGMSRKEIAALRRSPTETPSARLEDAPVVHVLGRWMGGPPYSSEEGRAHPLFYESVDDRIPTFVKLVQSLPIDLPPRALLDELLRVGAVELRRDGSVVLLEQSYIPAGDSEAKLMLLGSDPAELFSTIAHNIEHGDQPRLQRKVVYDNVGADALPEIRQRTTEVGEEFLRRANAMLAAYDRDRVPDAPAGSRSRVVLGVYYFEEGEGERRDSASPKPPGRIRRSQ